MTSKAGTTFDEEVDLSPGDWSDCDVDHDVPLSATEVESEWENSDPIFPQEPNYNPLCRGKSNGADPRIVHCPIGRIGMMML